MPNCRNPECMKEVPKDKTYCSADCLERHLEQKHPTTEDKKGLVTEEEVWLGQGRRKKAMDTIERLARELCPLPFNKFAYIVSYRTGLSLRKLTDDYLLVLQGVGVLKMDGANLTVVGADRK